MRWLSVRNKSADDFSFHEIEAREKIITKVGKNYRNPPTLGGKEAKEISRRGERKRSDGKRGELRSIVSRKRRTGIGESSILPSSKDKKCWCFAFALLIRGKSNVCWRKSVRRGKERREGHTRRLVARRGLSHRLCSLDYKNSPFGRHSREYTRNESIISIDRSIDGSLMKIVNARETWWEGRGEDGGTRCKCSQRATTRLFDCLYIIGRTDGIFLLLLLLDVKERKKANGWIYEGRRRLKFFQWNRRSEVFSFFLFFFLANRLFRLSRKWFVSYGIKWIQKLLKRKRVYE